MKKLILVLFLCSTANAGTILPYGNCWYSFCSPPEGNDFIQVSAGGFFGVALKQDSSIVAWGENSLQQCDTPKGNNFVAISTGKNHGFALDDKGFLYPWGCQHQGQDHVSTEGGWTQIASGLYCNVALRIDGTIGCWGYLDLSNDPYDDPNSWSGCKAIAANLSVLAIKENNTLIAWGGDTYGLSQVPEGTFKAIGCGDYHSLAIRTDGTLVAWGRNDYGQCDVPDGNDYIAVTGGIYQSAAIKSDGTLVTWGRPETDPNNLPPPYGVSLTQISGRLESFLALTGKSNITLTVNVDPPDINTVQPEIGIHNYYYGQKVFLNALNYLQCPYVWSFDYWSGDAVPDQKTQYITMDSNKSVTAYYKQVPKKCGDECHPILQGDLNGDCYINFADFAVYAEQWLACTHPDCDL